MVEGKPAGGSMSAPWQPARQPPSLPSHPLALLVTRCSQPNHLQCVFVSIVFQFQSPTFSMCKENVYRTQVYLGSDLWVRVSETHKHTLLKHIQVILVMMVTKKLDDVHKKLISSTFGPKKGHFGQSGPWNGPPNGQTETYWKTKGIHSYLRIWGTYDPN